MEFSTESVGGKGRVEPHPHLPVQHLKGGGKSYTLGTIAEMASLLTPEKVANLRPGEAFIWSSKATDDALLTMRS